MKQMRSVISVKNKAIAIVTVVVIVLSCLYFYKGSRLHVAAIDGIIAEKCISSDLIIDAIGTFSFDPYKKRIVNLLHNNDEIVQAFAAGDRQWLYQVAQPKYRSLQDENSQFYIMHFHLPDGSTLLRVHWPEFYGDDLTKVRPIVQAVHQRKVQQTGYEIGRRGLFYRIVQPVFHQGEYVGALELGIGVDHLLNTIRRQTNADVALFVRADRWQFAVDALQDDFFPFGEYMIHAGNYTIISQLPADFDFANSDTVIETQDKKSYIVHSHDYINDFSGEMIGGIMLIQDISLVSEQKTVFIQRFLVFASFLLACTLFSLYVAFGTLIGRLEKSRHHLKGVVEQLRDENLARRHVEQSLRESEKKSLSLLTNITHGIVLINADYTISKVNKATGKIFKKDEYAFLGKYCFHEFRQRNTMCPDCPGRQAMEEGSAHFIESTCVRKNGERFITKKTAFPLPMHDNKQSGFVLILEDLTKQKQTEKSVQKFEHIVDASLDHIVFIDSNYIYQNVNEAYLKAHNLQKNEVIGRSLADVRGSEVFSRTLKKNFDKALAGSLAHCQYWYEYPQLGLRYMDEIYSPFREKDGAISGIVVNSRDITRLKAVESELKRYEDIVSASKDHMSFVDTEYVYQAVNDAYLHDYQKKRAEIVGHSVISLLGPEKFKSTVQEKLDRALSGEVVVYEGWFTMPAIGERYREVSYVPFYDENKTISGVVVNSRDMTERKKMERYLQQVQKKEALGTLSAGIAHDFNNILGTIIGCTELALLDIQEDAGCFNDLIQVRTAAYRAKDLVQQILSFSRLQLGEAKAIHIIPLINETIDMVRATLPETIDIRISLEAENDVIMGDESEIMQMILNLCTNAVQAMAENEGMLEVSLARVDGRDVEAPDDKKAAHYLNLTVADSGCGIEASIWERIFDPYFTTKGVTEGTGLGLAIVQTIVKNHGGLITFDSVAEKGTTMRVFLPCHNQQGTDEMQT